MKEPFRDGVRNEVRGGRPFASLGSGGLLAAVVATIFIPLLNRLAAPTSDPSKTSAS